MNIAKKVFKFCFSIYTGMITALGVFLVAGKILIFFEHPTGWSFLGRVLFPLTALFFLSVGVSHTWRRLKTW